jgi:multidrug efflux pump subunit AcrA (membrane-fusion protein)
MRRFLIAFVVVAIAAGVYVLVRRDRGSPAADPNPGIEEPVTAGDQVVAEGRVVPVRGVTLSSQTGGVVAETLAQDGDQVAAGGLILRFDGARQAAAAVLQAEAGLRRARARVAELRAGARPQDLAAARAAVAAAQARYNQIASGARTQERAQAQAQVEQAERRADAARQRVAQAESALRLAESDLQRLEQLLAQQAVARQSVDQARERVTVARSDLEAARAELGAASAQASAAREQRSLVQAGARKEEIEAAAADLRRAQAQLDLLIAGTRPETVAAAQADVAGAAAALKQAQAALQQTEVRAPLAGTVAWFGPKRGEFVAPGAPIARVGDLSVWQVETTDLTELSVANVRIGRAATVTVDGIPGLSLVGSVSKIKAFGENRQGDIVYTVVVTLNQQDPRLRWNMTASVSIQTK